MGNIEDNNVDIQSEFDEDTGSISMTYNVNLKMDYNPSQDGVIITIKDELFVDEEPTIIFIPFDDLKKKMAKLEKIRNKKMMMK